MRGLLEWLKRRTEMSDTQILSATLVLLVIAFVGVLYAAFG